MKKISSVVSYLFHPVIVPLQIILLYFALQYRFFTPLEYFTIIGQVAIVTCFIPISIYFLLRSIGLLSSSVMVNTTKERTIPFLINIVLLAILIKLVLYNNSAYELHIFFSGLLLTYFCLLIGSLFKYKFSVHIAILSGGLSFMTIFLTYQKLPIFMLIIFLIMITGLTATSRLYLRAHTSKEVIIGGLIGGVSQIIIWVLHTQKWFLQ